MKIGEALKALADRRFLSAPVILKPEKKQSIKEGLIPGYCGIVHVGSILETILRRLSQVEKKSEDTSTDKKATGPDEAELAGPEKMISEIAEKWKGLTKMGESFSEESVMALTDLSDICEGVTSAHLSWDLGKFIKRMFSNSEGNHVHRVVLFDDYGEVQYYITQSDVLRYVYKHLGDWKEVTSKTIEEIGLTPKEKSVVTVHQDSSTAKAFETMYEKKISCVGVVNDKGSLVGSLSNSDLRGLEPSEFALLDASVGKVTSI